MRSVGLSLVCCIIACSGNSLDVGSDEPTGGQPGDEPTSGGTGQNSTGGAYAGSSLGGASYGASTTGGNAGEADSGGSSYGGSAVPRGGAGGAAPAGGVGAYGTGGTSAGSPGITSCTDDFPLLGTWEGNLLDYFFAPIDDVRMELAEAGSGGIYGSFTLGRGSPPPPATDEEAWYPPGSGNGGSSGRGTGGAGGAAPSTGGSGGAPGTGSFGLWPGLPYTISRGAVCDASFRVQISSAELWDSWCRLQTPVYTEGYGWNVILVGNGTLDQDSCEFTAENGDTAIYTRAQCDLASYCVCNEGGCRYSPDYGPIFDFSLIRNGDADVLTAPDSDGGQQTIRLQRVQ